MQGLPTPYPGVRISKKAASERARYLNTTIEQEKKKKRERKGKEVAERNESEDWKKISKNTCRQ